MALIKCPECGKEMSDTLNSCPHCGYVFNKKNSNKTKKKYIIGIPIILCVLIIISICIFFLLPNSTKSFLAKIDSQDIESAKKIYEQDIQGNEAQEEIVKDDLLKKIEKIKTDYNNNVLQFDDAKKQLQELKQFDVVKTESNKALNYLNIQQDSNASYDKGNEYEKNGEYAKAIESYKKVDETNQNYETAQNNITKLIQEYKSVCITEANQYASEEDYLRAKNAIINALNLIKDDTELIEKKEEYENKYNEKLESDRIAKIETLKNNQKVIIVGTPTVKKQSDRYTSLYPDMLTAVIQNNSDQTIKSYIIGFLAFDSSGYPVKIKAPVDFNPSYEKKVSAADANVLPGGTHGDGLGSEIDTPHNISTILACVYSATFYDGTTWTNEYYSYWLEEYKEKPLH